MADKLKAPGGFYAEGRDCMAAVGWKPVFGADGYRLMFFKADDPNVCFKSRFSQKCSRNVTGLQNGVEYLVQVCAFSYDAKRREVYGELSRKISVVPVCDTLKVRPLLLNVGESKKLEIAYKGLADMLSFTSSNASVAAVEQNGMVTAKGAGRCRIRISAPGGEVFNARVVVGRRQLSVGGRAVLMFAGDLMCVASQQKRAEERGYDFFSAFDGVRELIRLADFSAGVLDPVCCDELPYEHEQQRVNGCEITANAPSSFIAAVAGAGFTGVSTSTDRCLSLGQDALDATVRSVRGRGLLNLGTMGDNPVVVNVRGFKLGVIAVTMIAEKLDGAEMFNFNARYDREYFVELVNRAVGMGAEYVVVMAHWGRFGSGRISRAQLEEARFMAASGADLIVGAHPHVVQSVRFIDTEDGRRVPCAFSLGNFISGQSDMREFRDGAVLRVELSRVDGEEKPRADISYIPVASEDGERVVCAYPPHNEFNAKSAERTAAYLGREVKAHLRRKSVAVFGSSILYKILTAGDGFKLDTAGMYLSPLSLGAKKVFDAHEGADGSLVLDIGKDIERYLRANTPDYVAVDFFTAASVSLYKDGERDCYFSNTKKLRRSEFYAVRRGDWIRVRPPFGESIAKPLVERFARRLLSVLPHERIVLFRNFVSSRQKSGVQLRTVPENERRNRFIRELEELFITIVDPMVVDLAGKYFVEEGSQITFEPEFYLDSYKAMEDIVSRGRTYVDGVDGLGRLDRVMKYYDSMSLRSYHKRLLDLEDAADKIIAQTSVEFCARNSVRLLKLKSSGVSELISVGEFFKGDIGAAEIVRAAEIINAVEKGNLSHPYDFYAPAFEGKFNIVKSIARQLSKEYSITVNEGSAELMFLLRGKPQLKRYVNSLYQFTADIWGSDLSREALNRCRGAHIGRFVFMQSPITYHEEPIDCSFSEGAEDFLGNKWRAKITRGAFRRDGMEQLRSSEASWLVVDFYGVICSMAEYHGGLFEVDDFMRRTEFFKNIRRECAECYLFEKRDMKYCFEQITRFSNEVLELYGENIVLIKADPKNICINRDFRLEKMLGDEKFELKKKFISLCEERFASVTKCCVIDISRSFYSADSYPLGGRHIVHYEDEFYRQAAKYLHDIFDGSERKLFKEVDENYILLRNLKLERD